MFRKCDLQKGTEVIRGWIDELDAVEGNIFSIKERGSGWELIRAHEYGTWEVGYAEPEFMELGSKFIKSTR